MRLGFKTPPNEIIVSQTLQKSIQNPNLLGISLYGFLFLSVCLQMACMASRGADVFTQLCRHASSVTQLRKVPPRRLIVAQPRFAPDAAFPLHSRSQFTQGLSELLFPAQCPQTSWPARHCAGSSPPKKAPPYPPPPCISTSQQIKRHSDIWNLKLHAFISMWKTDYQGFFSLFQHFPPRLFLS